MNIIITGASRGIGFETAIQLCKDGHRVIAVARNGKGLEKLQAVVTAAGAGNRLMVLPVDITSEKDIRELAFTAKTLDGKVDVLINNAGGLVNKPFGSISPEELRSVYEVNVFAPFRLIQALKPLLDGGHVVNIGSMGGVQGSAKFPGLSAYSSSKAALANLSELLAEELKESRIRVNCLALGAAQTEMLAEAFPGYEAPLSSAEMAKWIAWFAVNGQQFFNGKVLPVAVSTP
jgi:NAD(P)-dependent dehydrogenase (short-subunit alcohol dehydrogenase family)